MNKEEIEKAIKILLKEDRFYDDETEIKATKVLSKYINELEQSNKILDEECSRLEQKESILDKVTDKLKEDIDFLEFSRDRDMDNGYGEDEEDRAVRVYIESILNIIEGGSNGK